MVLIPIIVNQGSGCCRVTLNDVDTQHSKSGQWWLWSDIE